jgi:hypothetical protein
MTTYTFPRIPILRRRLLVTTQRPTWKSIWTINIDVTWQSLVTRAGAIYWHIHLGLSRPDHQTFPTIIHPLFRKDWAETKHYTRTAVLHHTLLINSKSACKWFPSCIMPWSGIRKIHACVHKRIFSTNHTFCTTNSRRTCQYSSVSSYSWLQVVIQRTQRSVPPRRAFCIKCGHLVSYLIYHSAPRICQGNIKVLTLRENSLN